MPPERGGCPQGGGGGQGVVAVEGVVQGIGHEAQLQGQLLASVHGHHDHGVAGQALRAGGQALQGGLEAEPGGGLVAEAVGREAEAARPAVHHGAGEGRIR